MSDHADYFYDKWQDTEAKLEAAEEKSARLTDERNDARYDAKAFERNFLDSETRAHDEKARAEAAEARVTELEAALTEARDWINEDEVAEPWPPMMERIDAALAAPTKEADNE